MAQFYIFLACGFAIILSFVIAGFYGIGIMAIGLMGIPITMLAINYIGGITTQAFQFSKVARVYGDLTDRLYKISWTSKNYGIYVQMINAVGVFLTNFTALGCFLILSKMPAVAIWKSFTLFGFLFGSSLAYFLKG